MGAGAGEVHVKYSRKGKLNEKNSCTSINPKKYSCHVLKKILTRNLKTKKHSCGSKIPLPPPPPIIFSNRPSLSGHRAELLDCVLETRTDMKSVKLVMKGNVLELWIASLTTCKFITVQRNCWMLIVTSTAQFFQPLLSRHLERSRTCPLNRDSHHLILSCSSALFVRCIPEVCLSPDCHKAVYGCRNIKLILWVGVWVW